MLKATCLFFYLQGKRALKLRFGAGRENITVLSVCSAAGAVLDPTIRGMEIKHYQTRTMENPKMVWILGSSCKIKIDVAK